MIDIFVKSLFGALTLLTPADYCGCGGWGGGGVEGTGGTACAYVCMNPKYGLEQPSGFQLPIV